MALFYRELYSKNINHLHHCWISVKVLFVIICNFRTIQLINADCGIKLKINPIQQFILVFDCQSEIKLYTSQVRSRWNHFKSHFITVRCQQEWGFFPKTLPSNRRTCFWRKPRLNTWEEHTHTDTHNSKDLLPWTTWRQHSNIRRGQSTLKEAREEHRELWTGRDFFFSLFLL